MATTSTLTSPEISFVDKLSSDWKYTPPSDNLWTARVCLHNSGDVWGLNSMENLYNNINEVNRAYEANIGSRWDVRLLNSSLTELNGASASVVVGEFYRGFTDEIGMFLCQNFHAPSITVRNGYETLSGMGGHTGFIRPGQYVESRVHAPTFTIGILETNFSLREIFFEKWAAAIAQQGLIEDDSLPNIKADFFIYHYSAGIPGYNERTWQLRKITKYVKCYPYAIDNSDTRLDYETDRSGKFKTSTITMAYDENIVEYFAAPSKSEKGWVHSSGLTQEEVRNLGIITETNAPGMK